MKAEEFVKDVKNSKIDIVENTKLILKEANETNREYNYFAVVSEAEALEQAESLKKNAKSKEMKLLGLPVSVKDSICVKGIESTAY